MTDLKQTEAVDAFVHPKAEQGMDSIMNHMSKPWRQRFTSLAMSGQPSFAGAAKADLVARSREAIGTQILVPREMVNAWPDPNLTTNFLHASNEYFVSEWAGEGSQYKLAVLVCVQDPAWSAKEIHRLAQNKNVVAVALAPMHVLLGDALHYPIYEACVATELPVIVYPTGAEGLYIGAAQTAGGALLSHVERRTLLSQIAQANIGNLVFQGVFERFPALKVLFAGFGFSWLFPLLWRMDMDWRRTRVETPWVKVPPSEYVRRHVRLTTEPNDAPDDDKEFASSCEMNLADAVLMFGSDYPASPVSEALNFVGRLDPALRERVMRSAALETFPRLKDAA